MKVSEAVAELPARSVAVACTVFDPGTRETMHEIAPPVTVAGIPLHVTLAMPEAASAAVPDSVTEGV